MPGRRARPLALRSGPACRRTVCATGVTRSSSRRRAAPSGSTGTSPVRLAAASRTTGTAAGLLRGCPRRGGRRSARGERSRRARRGSQPAGLGRLSVATGRRQAFAECLQRVGAERAQALALDRHPVVVPVGQELAGPPDRRDVALVQLGRGIERASRQVTAARTSTVTVGPSSSRLPLTWMSGASIRRTRQSAERRLPAACSSLESSHNGRRRSRGAAAGRAARGRRPAAVRAAGAPGGGPSS